MSCPTIDTPVDIEPILEGYIVDWMIDLKNNLGLMRNIEEIYPEETIVSNNAAVETTMYSMADEIARIKYLAKTLHGNVAPYKALVDAKLGGLCARRDEHYTNQQAWISYRAGLDPEDPNYSSDYANATNEINNNQTVYNNRVTDINTLKSNADAVIALITNEFNELKKGVLKARYISNRSVGSLITEDTKNNPDGDFLPTDVSTSFAYVIKALNKIGKWAEFSQSLDITNKLKSITFNNTVADGTGNYSSIIDALSARDAEFNDSNELVVTTDMEYKPALIAAYGPGMISAISSSKSDIDGEYAFLQDLLITRITDQIVTYATNGSWTLASATFEIPSWYDARNQDLDDLQDAYDPLDDPTYPYP